eukprot:4433049-Prymnesium_polylepis.2
MRVRVSAAFGEAFEDAFGDVGGTGGGVGGCGGGSAQFSKYVSANPFAPSFLQLGKSMAFLR